MVNPWSFSCGIMDTTATGSRGFPHPFQIYLICELIHLVNELSEKLQQGPTSANGTGHTEKTKLYIIKTYYKC